jgi:hypothetical protein
MGLKDASCSARRASGGRRQPGSDRGLAKGAERRFNPLRLPFQPPSECFCGYLLTSNPPLSTIVHASDDIN